MLWYLLDEKRLKAVHEILQNRIVPKRQIKDFLSSPTAYIDASAVDLEVGFSARVKGVTVFQQAYFGDTDGSGIDWFNKETAPENILAITQLPKYIHAEEDLLEFEQLYKDTKSTNSTVITFKCKLFDITDSLSVDAAIDEIRQGLKDGRFPEEDNDTFTDDEQEETGEPKETETQGKNEEEQTITPPDGDGEKPTLQPNGSLVVDIIDNDEELQYSLEKAISHILFSEHKLIWENYSNHPPAEPVALKM